MNWLEEIRRQGGGGIGPGGKNICSTPGMKIYKTAGGGSWKEKKKSSR